MGSLLVIGCPAEVVPPGLSPLVGQGLSPLVGLGLSPLVSLGEPTVFHSPSGASSIFRFLPQSLLNLLNYYFHHLPLLVLLPSYKDYRKSSELLDLRTGIAGTGPTGTGASVPVTQGPSQLPPEFHYSLLLLLLSFNHHVSYYSRELRHHIVIDCFPLLVALVLLGPQVSLQFRMCAQLHDCRPFLHWGNGSYRCLTICFYRFPSVRHWLSHRVLGTPQVGFVLTKGLFQASMNLLEMSMCGLQVLLQQ